MVGPSQKNSNTFVASQIEAFSRNKVVNNLRNFNPLVHNPLAHRYTIQAHTYLGNWYGANNGAIGEYLGCMLSRLIAWDEFPFLTLFVNRLLQALGYLVWFTLMSCGASHSFFPFKKKWATLIGPSLKKKIETLGMFCSLTPMLTFFAWIFLFSKTFTWICTCLHND